MEVLDEAADEDRGRLEKNVQETASTLTGTLFIIIINKRTYAVESLRV